MGEGKTVFFAPMDTKIILEPSMMGHRVQNNTYNPSTHVAELGGSRGQDQPELHEIVSNKQN